MNARKLGFALLVVIGIFCLFLTAFRVLPIPEGLDAITLCFPVTGPVQRFSKNIEAERRQLVHIHEAVHAEQCRTMGPIRYLTTSRTAQGRLFFESAAFCAELRAQVKQGFDAEQLSTAMVHALFLGYGNKGTMSEPEIRAMFQKHCSDVVPAPSLP
jgi:hypothetical protein